MSPVVTKPEAVGPEPAPAGAPQRETALKVDRDLAWAGALGAGLVAVAFLTKASFGGADLGANTWVEIALLILGAGALAAVVLVGNRGPAWGVMSLALFAALSGLTYASIGWSVQPSNSWLEGNRTLAYLAVFGGALALGRLAPARWRSVIGAVAIASIAISGWALLTKVFPGSLDAGDILGRLSPPFGYWNAVGLVGALGLPPWLWAGARSGAPRWAQAISVPAVTVLLTAMVMSYGRAAIGAAVIGVGLWLAFVPFRLRAALTLLLGAAGAAIATAWALGHHALTHDRVALAARSSAGHTFGVVLALVLAAMIAVGVGTAIASERITLTPALRRSAMLALVGVAALIPVAGVAALAASSRGLTGEVSHLWHELTSPQSRVGSTPNRLVQLGSSRPTYWHEGFEVGAHHLLAGAGAGGFEVASLRYAKSKWAFAAQAHSYVVQTFADFGLIGLALSAALLIAWAVAATRTLRLRGSRAGPEELDERIGLITMLAVVVVFGIHSVIDWTWFVDGVAIPALICAGWIAGRGPLAQRVGRLARARRVTEAPAAFAVLTVTAAVVVGLAWVTWQPLRAADADAAAVTASAAGNTRAAFADARAAADDNPESVEPLFELSALYTQIHDPARARLELLRATALQPQNPDTWAQLGEFDLGIAHRPRLALGELERAHLLEPASRSISSDIGAAVAAVSR